MGFGGKRDSWGVDSKPNTPKNVFFYVGGWVQRIIRTIWVQEDMIITFVSQYPMSSFSVNIKACHRASKAM